jgi:hypothetical protein
MPCQLNCTGPRFRLVCALGASALIGLNRSQHGHAAGLRTSILVCLAACLAMIQVNLLLPLAGRSPNSFVMNDLMRWPLGILSGMGFILGRAPLCGATIWSRASPRGQHYGWLPFWACVSEAAGRDRAGRHGPGRTGAGRAKTDRRWHSAGPDLARSSLSLPLPGPMRPGSGPACGMTASGLHPVP